MKYSLTIHLMLFSSFLFGQNSTQLSEEVVNEFLADSSYNIQCYYLDFNGKYHFFDRIIVGNFSFTKKDMLFSNDGDFAEFDEDWASIGYYQIRKDTAYFHQKILFKGNIMGILFKSYVTHKYWMGEDISNDDFIDESEIKEIKRKARIRDVVFSSDSIGSVMIWSHVVSGGSPSFNSYIGATPGQPSAPVYGGSGSNMRDSGTSGSMSNIYEIVTNDSIHTILTNIAKYDSNKNLNDSSQKEYDLILKSLESNTELYNLFKVEFQRILDESFARSSQKKVELKWSLLDYSEVLNTVMQRYYEKYIVHFESVK